MMDVCVLLVSVVIQTGGNPAAWAEESIFQFSSISNNTWALDKSTRQLILVNFEKSEERWKSQPVIIPEELKMKHYPPDFMKCSG